MKRLFSLLSVWLTLACATAAVPQLPVIPMPASVQQGNGQFQLKNNLNIGYPGGTDAAIVAELKRFSESLSLTTGLRITCIQGKGGIEFMSDASVPAEGYILDITPKGCTVKASSPAGLFYAFQTIKQMLPPNVAAGTAPAGKQSYSLPAVSITDAPRFPYRGFMLDVSRHFFDADQIKKMLDVMSLYKMNRFHWHLTDDQGWRLPVAKYPRLTEEGATANNVMHTDFDRQTRVRNGESEIYGPFAYTPDEIRDIVAYARERHIEILPEIDMPGHMVAAIHAYPELSTDPESRLVPDSIGLDCPPGGNDPLTHFTHKIWNTGGVSRDVLDVSNPKVMQFAKDVVDVLAEFFPYEYIHIGGDECPTLAWQKSGNCQKLKAELGLKNDRALQAWFTKQISDYAASRHGKKIMGWNELISEADADMETVKAINPVIMCWIGADQAAQKAQENGLGHIYTAWQQGYYINRSYRDFDKIGAACDGSIAQTYMHCPPDWKKCAGVQGTFWTEQVERPQDLEYLALPRLMAIAEHGWSPASVKDYENFMNRLSATSRILDLGGYNYAKHQIPVRPNK